MRTAIRSKRGPRAPNSTAKSYSAPISGWNARDALASMSPTDAVVLSNWFPRPSFVESRGGSAISATGMTGTGKTLLTYNRLSGTNQLFCFTQSGTFNVSAAGAVGASVLARTNGKHQWVMFGDGTSNWSIAVNGVDKPAYYDGTTWTAVTNATVPALTGYTGNAVEDFINVNVFKGRVFFIPKNSLAFWYLPSGVAGGALAKFDLSTEARKGGFLVAMATWTRDSGAGADDYAVFFTSEGEAMVYQGTNPASATTWAKIGSYSVGKPLGYRCVTQYGADCVVLTEDGPFPMSALLQTGEVERAKYALSYKIQNAMTEVARAYGTTFGWKTILYPQRDALILNVPIAENGTHEQYVMNTITKSWCKFTGWNAEDFGIFNGELYFVNGSSTFKAWTGTSDLGANITYYAKQAFQNFGDSNPKQIKMFMPILTTNGAVSYGVDVDVDFADDEISGIVSFSVTSGAVWNASNWSESFWSIGSVVVRQWTSPSEWPGRWIAGKLKIASLNLTVQWTASTMIYEQAPSL